MQPLHTVTFHKNFKYHGRGVNLDDHLRVDQDRRIHWVSEARRVPQAVVWVRQVTIRTASEVRAQKKSSRSVINTQKDTVIHCLLLRAAHRNRTNTGLRPFFTGTRNVPLGDIFFSVRPVIIRSGWGHSHNLTSVYSHRMGTFIGFSFGIFILIKDSVFDHIEPRIFILGGLFSFQY